MKKTKILSIIGPTATGKTNLAINLAKQFGGEIISGDSMQIYKEFDILSAKPTPLELAEVKHHLVDFLSVKEAYSVAKFKEMASKCIIAIKNENKLPILVGGTGLYIDSLIKNIDFNAPSSKAENIFLPDSGEKLMEMLKKVDPESAVNIHVNNIKRLKRALEFYYTVGRPISKQVSDSKKAESPYEVCKIGLNFKNREILYSKINKRVDEMINRGILDEVRRVYAKKEELSKTAQAAIGYKEIADYLEGRETLENAYENVKKFSRRYAKRQITWFKRDENVNWIYIDDYQDFSQVIKKAKEITEKFIQ